MALAPSVELQSLPEGGAVAVVISAPADSIEIRVIRRPDRAPTNERDIGPGEIIVSAHPSAIQHNGLMRELLDYGTVNTPLIDGKAYFYGVFSKDSTSTWSMGATGSATPETRIEVSMPDPIDIVNQRLAQTLKRLLVTDRYNLREEVKQEGIRVYEAIPLDEVATPWPCFSVHLNTFAESQQYIGQAGLGDRSYPDKLDDERATLHEVTLAILGWTQNDIERGVLRRLLRDALAADRLFYVRLGFIGLTYEGPQDDESFNSSSPVYNVVCNMRFQMLIQPRVKVTTKIASAEARRLVLVASGVISAAAAGTLSDSVQAWQTNVWHRTTHLVRVVSGPGVGQQRHIVSNTGSVLTIEPDWVTIPSVGESYAIYRVEEPQENQVVYQTNPG